jgi:hypothetical protein
MRHFTDAIFEDLIAESKADEQQLINFAGEELAKKFLAIKARLKAPENDLYYWIKNKSVKELANFITNFTATKSKTQQKKGASAGAELLAETSHYKIYEISSLAASQKYGRDTTWCISSTDGSGEDFWCTLGADSVYFLINKQAEPRTWGSKFAIVIYPDATYEIRDVNDNAMFFNEIPYFNEINLPGKNILTLNPIFVTCAICEEEINQDDAYEVDEYGVHYCSACNEE